MSDATAVTAASSSPGEIRARGLKMLAGAVGILVVARLYLWAQISLWPGDFHLPGVIFILPPVIAAFGLTQVVTGSDRSWLRIPLVVIFAIVLIGATFWLMIPRGYGLTSG